MIYKTLTQNLKLKTKNYILCLIFFFIALLALSTPVYSSTYIPVEDDLFYTCLARLEAEGVITSGLLDTRPISRREAFRLVREAEMNSAGKSRFIKDLVNTLRQRLGPETAGTQLKPLDSAYFTYIHTDSEVSVYSFRGVRENRQALNYNNNGDLYQRGSNERAGFISRLEDWGAVSFLANPEFRYPQTPFTKDDLIAKKAYAVVDLWGWDALIGRDSQWWGPGYHGSLLLSNNAEPFTMIRINNPEPVTLPWFLKHLGPARFTFFVTNLEKSRTDVPEPYLYGVRFDFKPFPGVDLGLQKTALLGGQGRSEDLKTWVKSIVGSGEHENGESGDQRAGYYIKLSLPFDTQPVQIYADAAAEDTVGLKPVQWAYIYGIYLPRILSFERLEFRYEWAETYDRHEPSSWYTHHIFNSGYAYESRIIGHHMGGNARDNFIEVTCSMPEKGLKLRVWHDIEEQNISNPIREKTHETGIRINAGLTGRLSLDASYGYSSVKNPGNSAGPVLRSNMVEGEIKYSF